MHIVCFVCFVCFVHFGITQLRLSEAIPKLSLLMQAREPWRGGCELELTLWLDVDVRVMQLYYPKYIKIWQVIVLGTTEGYFFSQKRQHGEPTRAMLTYFCEGYVTNDDHVETADGEVHRKKTKPLEWLDVVVSVQAHGPRNSNR